jgi:hypothetical protein
MRLCDLMRFAGRALEDPMRRSHELVLNRMCERLVRGIDIYWYASRGPCAPVKGLEVSLAEFRHSARSELGPKDDKRALNMIFNSIFIGQIANATQ